MPSQRLRARAAARLSFTLSVQSSGVAAPRVPSIPSSSSRPTASTAPVPPPPYPPAPPLGDPPSPLSTPRPRVHPRPGGFVYVLHAGAGMLEARHLQQPRQPGVVTVRALPIDEEP